MTRENKCKYTYLINIQNFNLIMLSTKCIHFKRKILKNYALLKFNTRKYSSPVELSFKIHGPDMKKNVPPIIILHGLLGSKNNWASISRELAKHSISVVAVDLRNHGESPHTDSHTYNDLVQDVDQLMEKLNISKATLIGHSMGGRAAMVFSLLMPNKVANLIVVDISPVPSARALTSNFFPTLLDAMRKVKLESMTTISEARKIAKEDLKSTTDNEDTLNHIVLNLSANPDKQIVWKLNIDSLKAFYRSDIASFPKDVDGKQFSGPSIFIGGDQSDFMPVEDLPAILKYFPSAAVQYISNAGHNVHADAPKEFVEIVLRFLEVKQKQNRL